MEPIEVVFAYPDRTKEGRQIEKTSFAVTDDNVETIIGEANPIDCVCDAMKLVIMEKCERQVLDEGTISFFKDLDLFVDFANGMIISYFTEENERKFYPIKQRLEMVLNRSTELANNFYDVYDRCNEK